VAVGGAAELPDRKGAPDVLIRPDVAKGPELATRSRSSQFGDAVPDARDALAGLLPAIKAARLSPTWALWSL
jgi:hypothetical protein